MRTGMFGSNRRRITMKRLLAESLLLLYAAAAFSQKITIPDGSLDAGRVNVGLKRLVPPM